ncbi:PP2C family protein-serine/threonine phosphatase [Cellulomonas sp. Root137]|uniref:PP2C family protein-serine/threonine phosphatase n=1 Tax=Cellulomonas sp. Root137 TaxID=1736459 RepID=UPI000AE5B2DF|nr:PP2C family protein-serine/threonine phosphatase [Cellulomonas sp. Root137]
MSSDDKVVEHEDDLPLNAVLSSDLALSISDALRPDDPLVWVNGAFSRLTGYPADEVLGRNCRFLQGADTDPIAVGRIRTAMDDGRAVAAVIRNYRRDGSPFWNQVVISPVVDETGRVTHHVGIQADVTERVAADQVRDLELDLVDETAARLDLLAHISDELAKNLDYDAAVDALGDIAIPALAAWGFVAITDDRGRFSRVHLVAGDLHDRETVRALANQDISWLTRAPKIAEALTSSPGFVATPYAIDTASLPGRTTPDQLDLLRRLGLGQAMVVPLRARDRVLGVLTLVAVDGFGADAVVTAAHLGRRAGLALDNVRLFLAERTAVLTLQHSLLPEIPEIPGLDVAAAYIPSGRQAEVGGDWFDVLPLPDGAIGLAVGDVVGHDLRAAAAMGQLRSLLRSYAWEGSSPGEVLARADELVRGLDIADISTCAYLRWRPNGEGAHVTYARAGHPPPLLRLAGGEVRALDEGLSTPIGLAGPGGAEATIDVPPRATLVLYTDGLVERRDRGLREGIALLTAELSSLPDDVDATTVKDRLVERFIGPYQEDDVCLLVVRRALPTS